MERMTKKEFKQIVKKVWKDAKTTNSGIINLNLLIDERHEGSILEYSNMDDDDDKSGIIKYNLF